MIKRKETMKKWAGTLIGGGLGFALLGPLGGIVGAYVGSMVSQNNNQGRRSSRQQAGNQYYSNTYSQGGQQQVKGGDFAVALLALLAHVTKADDQVKSSEVQYVKDYITDKFSYDDAQDMMYLYKNILDENYNVYDVTQQVKANLNYNESLEMLHVLFELAGADGTFSRSEMEAIREISNGLGINQQDYQSLRSMFINKGSEVEQAYEILGITSDADDSEVKKAYHEMANKYHPDKVDNLGDDIKNLAEEKFKSINDAYKKIKETRGMK